MMLTALMREHALVANPDLIISSRLVVDVRQDDVTHANLAAVYWQLSRIFNSTLGNIDATTRRSAVQISDFVFDVENRCVVLVVCVGVVDWILLAIELCIVLICADLILFLNHFQILAKLNLTRSVLDVR